jgi:hypothetical protein
MAARPQRTVQYQQRVSATRTIAVTRTVYADATLADALHYAGVLDERQHTAACRLYGLHLAAGLLPRLTPRVDVVHDEAEEEADASEGVPDGEARWVYRQLLREVGPVYGPALDALMLGRHGGIGRYTVIQDALDALADRWGMDVAPSL